MPLIIKLFREQTCTAQLIAKSRDGSFPRFWGQGDAGGRWRAEIFQNLRKRTRRTVYRLARSSPTIYFELETIVNARVGFQYGRKMSDRFVFGHLCLGQIFREGQG